MQSSDLDSEGYWSNELKSLGNHAKYEQNNKEMRDLVEKVKQVLSQEYHATYDHE